jgi:hypothetical protein
MDEFEKRLKQDAARIRAKVSPQLEERIAASLHSAGRDIPLTRRRSGASKLWWASSLTGLAAALIVIVVVNLNPTPVEAPLSAAAVAETVPDYRYYVEDLRGQLPLRVHSVELTAGLEEELARLQADLEKARATVAKDMDFTF